MEMTRSGAPAGLILLAVSAAESYAADDFFVVLQRNSIGNEGR
jgi:hypothetical protein